MPAETALTNERGSSAAAPDNSPYEKKRLYEWTPPVRPTRDDLFAGGDRTRAWLRYWVSGKIHDGFDIVMHRLLSRLPIGWTSDFGASLGWFVVRKFKPKTVENARANFHRLRPDWSSTEIEQAIARLYRHIGRIMAEFSHLTKMAPAGLLNLRNPEVLLNATGQGPVVIVSLHTGNWEVGAAALHSMGIRWADFYTPPAREVQHRIANEIRESFGIQLLQPGRAGVRPAIRVLKGGGVVSIFCDEVHDDRVMAPFFGRPPHTQGNLAVAVRLARLTGARIVIGYTVRTKGCRFDILFEEPIEYAPGEAAPDQLNADILALNDRIERVISTHLDQWYFLDNDL